MSILDIAIQTYAARKKAGMKAGCVILLRVFQRHKRKRILRAWVEDYKEVRRAKRWFNREREGEGEEGEGEREWYWPEGEDYISSLPREVAVKVSRTEEMRDGRLGGGGGVRSFK